MLVESIQQAGDTLAKVAACVDTEPNPMLREAQTGFIKSTFEVLSDPKISPMIFSEATSISIHAPYGNWLDDEHLYVDRCGLGLESREGKVSAFLWASGESVRENNWYFRAYPHVMDKWRREWVTNRTATFKYPLTIDDLLKDRDMFENYINGISRLSKKLLMKIGRRPPSAEGDARDTQLTQVLLESSQKIDRVLHPQRS